MKFKKIYVFEIVIFILFISFLLYIPTIFNDNDKYEKEKTVEKTFGENSKAILETKYNLMLDNIVMNFNETKINEMNDPFLIELIIDNKISNKEHTLAQELIKLYEKNYSSEMHILAENIINFNINKFESPEESRWTNQLFLFRYYDEEIIMHNVSNLLIGFNESKSFAIKKSFFISPYEKEKYDIYFINGTNETIIVDLITREGEERLEKFTNINNSKNIKNMKSEFISSQENYLFEFYIWK